MPLLILCDKKQTALSHSFKTYIVKNIKSYENNTIWMMQFNRKDKVRTMRNIQIG